MSAMDKMLMQMVVNAVPENMRQHFSPEGMEALGIQAAEVMNFFKAGILLSNKKADAILLNQQVIMEALNVGSSFNSGPSVQRSDPADSNASGSVAA